MEHSPEVWHIPPGTPCICGGVAGGWVSGAAESKWWQIGQQKWLLQIKKCEFDA